jgi:hypothetical protein
LLDEEVAALPGPYRSAFILCHLQGMTNEQASRELGCPLGTVLSRLARARSILRDRLTQRGVTLSTGVLTAVLAENAVSAAVPAAYIEQTMKAAVLFAAHKGVVTGFVSAHAVTHAVTLAEGVLRTMYLTSLRFAAGIVLAAGIISTAVYSQQGPPKDLPDVATNKPSGPDKPERPALVVQPDKGISGTRFDKNDDSVPSPRPGNPFDQPNPSAQKAADPLGSVSDRPFTDPAKERLRLANKLLQEEIEDEKDRLEALQKKLQRLKNSGLSVPQGDPELAKLRQQNRLLQQQLKGLQEEVRAVEEEVGPFKQALLKGAGHDLPKPGSDAEFPRNNFNNGSKTP